MSKAKKRTATLEKKREEQPVVGIPDSWPAAERAAPQPEAAKKDSPLNRLSFRIHTLAVRVLSNLRLSLTLRIALHYAGQLLRSTLTVLLVGMLALCVAQVPMVNKALDELNLMTPQGGAAARSARAGGAPER
ncbi:MAG: hypothetical protein RSC98_06960 [Clostridia bacterium]